MCLTRMHWTADNPFMRRDAPPHWVGASSRGGVAATYCVQAPSTSTQLHVFVSNSWQSAFDRCSVDAGPSCKALTACLPLFAAPAPPRPSTSACSLLCCAHSCIGRDRLAQIASELGKAAFPIRPSARLSRHMASSAILDKSELPKLPVSSHLPLSITPSTLHTHTSLQSF